MDNYEIPDEYKQRELLVNKIRCPDGTILQSTHRHDFKHHIQEDGREYFVDGGTQYQRIGYSDLEFEDLTLYTDDPHEKIREEFIWGRNFDKKGKKLPQTEYLALKDLEDDHLESLCHFTLKGYPAKINQILVNEWNYRIEKKSDKEWFTSARQQDGYTIYAIDSYKDMIELAECLDLFNLQYDVKQVTVSRSEVWVKDGILWNGCERY